MLENCPICLEDREDILKFPCSHPVCGDCFDKLHRHNPNKILCPLCRYVLVEIKENEDEDENENNYVTNDEIPDHDIEANVIHDVNATREFTGSPNNNCSQTKFKKFCKILTWICNECFLFIFALFFIIFCLI